MTTATFERHDLAPRIGTAIHASRETLLSGVLATEIRATLEARGVIAFPQINLTDAEQVAFTRSLGQIVEEGEGNVYKITMDPAENVQAEYLKAAFFWHIDGTTLNVPIFASIMSARVLSDEGGDTLFSNTYAAYDDLPVSEKAALEELRVVHAFEVSQRYVTPEPSWEEMRTWQQYPEKTLPLVWTHRSGRKSLVLGSTASHVVGMTPRDSVALLTRLRDYATQQQFVYRHRWSVGDMVIWDNTGTMHKATRYPLDSGRMMHRTKLQGEEAFA